MKKNNRKQKILITGSSGLVGKALFEYFKKKNFEVFGIDLKKTDSSEFILDMAQGEDFLKLLKKINPDIIIHTAAQKSLFECENNKNNTWITNVSTTNTIVQYTYKSNKCKIIYISSDMIFSGDTGNYKEDSLPNPINWYGITKLHSELLLKQLNNYAICRTALVIGDLNKEDYELLNIEVKNNVLNIQSLLPFYVIKRLKAGKKVFLSKRNISSPTSIDLIVVSIMKIIEQDLVGVYHVAGSESISRYDFGLMVAKRFNLPINLIYTKNSSVLKYRPDNISLYVKNTYKKLNLNTKDWNIKNSIIKIIERNL